MEATPDENRSHSHRRLAYIKVDLSHTDRWGFKPDWTITARFARLKGTSLRGRVLGYAFDTTDERWRVIFQRSDSNIIYTIAPDEFARDFELSERKP